MFKSIASAVVQMLKLKTSNCLADVSVRVNRGNNKAEKIVLNDVAFTTYAELEKALTSNTTLKAALADNDAFNKFVKKLPATTLQIKELTIPHEQSVKKQVAKITIEIPPYTVTITISWK